MRVWVAFTRACVGGTHRVYGGHTLCVEGGTHPYVWVAHTVCMGGTHHVNGWHSLDSVGYKNYTKRGKRM